MSNTRWSVLVARTVFILFTAVPPVIGAPVPAPGFEVQRVLTLAFHVVPFLRM